MEEKFKVPVYEIENRINRIQIAMKSEELEGLLIIQRADLFYLSGTAQSAFLFIPADGEPLLMVKRYLPRAKSESPLRNIVEIKSVIDIPGRIIDFYGSLPKIIGFELDVVPVNDFRFYQSLFPQQECVDASEEIKKVRMIKSFWEIEQIERVAELSCRTFEYINKNIRAGYTEMEFAGMFETFARRHGHPGKLRVRDYQTEGYAWHILSGESGGMMGVLDSPASGEGTSVAFPCGAGGKKLAPGEPIMIDLGSALNGYHFDETRMFAIKSMPVRAFNASLKAIEIHNELLNIVKPGLSSRQLFEKSVAMSSALGCENSYLGLPGYKMNFVGHGIGTELIEYPFIAARNDFLFEPGMVFAIEPKMVFENEFAAGIESVFAVTEKGHRLISQTPVKVFFC